MGKKILAGFAMFSAFIATLAGILVVLKQDQVVELYMGRAAFTEAEISFIPEIVRCLVLFILALVIFFCALTNHRIATMIISLVTVILYLVMMIPMNIINLAYTTYIGRLGTEYVAKYSCMTNLLGLITPSLIALSIIFIAIITGLYFGEGKKSIPVQNYPVRNQQMDYRQAGYDQ